MPAKLSKPKKNDRVCVRLSSGASFYGVVRRVLKNSVEILEEGEVAPHRFPASGWNMTYDVYPYDAFAGSDPVMMQRASQDAMARTMCQMMFNLWFGQMINGRQR